MKNILIAMLFCKAFNFDKSIYVLLEGKNIESNSRIYSTGNVFVSNVANNALHRKIVKLINVYFESKVASVRYFLATFLECDSTDPSCINIG